MKEIIRKTKLTDKEAAEYRQALIEEGMVCANCGKELERPHQVHNCMVDHGPRTLEAKWLDPECWDGCQSLVYKHRCDRLRKALDAATDVGIYPESVKGRSLGPGVAVSGYEKRTEFMEGWNAHSLAAIKEVAKILQPGDWEDNLQHAAKEEDHGSGPR